MTAAELFEALQGVPAEALCNYLDYATYSDGQPHWRIGFMPTTDQIAAALQRDAMTEWLYSIGYQCWPEHWDHGTHKSWSINIDRRGESYPTRLHALAAACRFVAGQKGAEK